MVFRCILCCSETTKNVEKNYKMGTKRIRNTTRMEKYKQNKCLHEFVMVWHRTVYVYIRNNNNWRSFFREKKGRRKMERMNLYGNNSTTNILQTYNKLSEQEKSLAKNTEQIYIYIMSLYVTRYSEYINGGSM